MLVKKHLVGYLQLTSSCTLNPEQHPVRQRPIRLAAHRQSELMTISLIEENKKHIDWIEKDELEFYDVQFIPN